MNAGRVSGCLRKSVGVYIHIPFCKKRCSYCDFISFENKQNEIEEYVSAIIKEIKTVGAGFHTCPEKLPKNIYEINTIYIGGGTPSYIESKYIEEILNTIKKEFKVAENAEITIEVNPGTVNKEKLQTYYNVGVNRLSIGMQSTNNEELKLIERIHTYEEFLNTYELASEVRI